MSFILDALKKSETDRQERSSAEFARVPTSSGPTRAPAWLWLLGFLLAVNLVVLMGLFLKPSNDDASSVSLVDEMSALPDSEPALVAPKVSDSEEDQPSFASRVAAAKQSQPMTTDAITPSPAEVDAGQSQDLPVDITPQPAPATSLPTIYEVVADGTVVLPELHLDIHVYSDVPEDRFVFINMSKLREKSQLSEGPLVREITPDGVILEYRGTSFLLPRE